VESTTEEAGGVLWERNTPTPEFRREAVRLALTGGRTRREIAEDLRIGLSALTWRLGQERECQGAK
jgi:transposase-like protein